MQRDKEFDTRLDEIERAQRRMAEEIEQLQRELKAQGITLPELNPAGDTPLSPESNLRQLQLAAKRARAAKTVGGGKGAVQEAETAERFATELKEAKRD